MRAIAEPGYTDVKVEVLTTLLSEVVEALCTNRGEPVSNANAKKILGRFAKSELVVFRRNKEASKAAAVEDAAVQ